MRHGAAVSFRFSFSVAEGVVWARRVAAKEVERQHHRGRGVTEFVTLESAVWRTDPALSRNLKPPPLGGGVFTPLEAMISLAFSGVNRGLDILAQRQFDHDRSLEHAGPITGYGCSAAEGHWSFAGRFAAPPTPEQRLDSCCRPSMSGSGWWRRAPWSSHR